MSSEYCTLQSKWIKNSSNVLSIKNYKISSQGVSKLHETIHMWPNKGKGDIFTDHKLQNIWTTSNSGNKIYCLRAGGVDQEVIDFNPPSASSHNYYVMDIGVGRSKICWIADGDNNKFCEVTFDKDGYVYNEKMLTDASHIFDEESLHSRVQVDTRVNLKNFMYPERTFVPLFTTTSGEYLIWDYYEGFKIMDALKSEHGSTIDPREYLNDHLCENIPLPGNNHAYRKDGYWRFSSESIEFSKDTIIGFIPIGDETPKPRFPMTISEKNFQEETRKDIEMIKGFLNETSEEWRNMFANR